MSTSSDKDARNGRFVAGNGASKRKRRRRMSAAGRLAYDELKRLLRDPKTADYVKRQAAADMLAYEVGKPVARTPEPGQPEHGEPGHRCGVVMLPETEPDYSKLELWELEALERLVGKT